MAAALRPLAASLQLCSQLAQQRAAAHNPPSSLPASCERACSSPPNRATLRTARSLVSENSKPRVKSSRCTPSCATDWTCRLEDELGRQAMSEQT